MHPIFSVPELSRYQGPFLAIRRERERTGTLAGHMPMPKYVKLILACLLCLAVITGLVLLIQRLF